MAYQTSFTLEHVISTLTDRSLTDVYQNSLFVAVCTAAGGLLVTYGSALATARSGLNSRLKAVIDGIALVTNTIPGMVVGIAFLFIFTGTPLQNTLILIIICNIVHFFFDAVSDDEKFACQSSTASWEPRRLSWETAGLKPLCGLSLQTWLLRFWRYSDTTL